MSMTRSSHPVTTASRFTRDRSSACSVLLDVRKEAVSVVLLAARDHVQIALDVVADVGLDAVIHRSVVHRSLLLTAPAAVICMGPRYQREPMLAVAAPTVYRQSSRHQSQDAAG